MELISEQSEHELIERAVSLAREYFVTAQFNCAESTFWGITQALNLPMDEPLKRIATPFGGGIGDSRATCGPLVAGVMALGLVLGRTELDTARKLLAYDRARKLYEGFVAEAGSDTCRVLNDQGFGRPDLRRYCSRFVMLATRLAATILLADNP